MKLQLPRPRRMLRWLLILLVIAIPALYLVFPAALGVAAVLPLKQSAGAAPAGFEGVTLTTEDGVDLAAWYAPPANAPAIILLHGAGDSREAVRDYAAMLVRNGYGVLAVDLRGHGASGGTTNKLGWQGTHDVEAAVGFLQARDEVTAIGALGLSMGGEVALGAASAVPAITAIVADGATRRSTAELRALESERPLYRNFTARVFYATVQALTGQKPPKPLLDSMREAERTHFYLIAAGSNDLEVAFNELFADTLGERAALWVAPDVSHTGAFSRYPDEYEQRVTGFFDTTLRGEPSMAG